MHFGTRTNVTVNERFETKEKQVLTVTRVVEDGDVLNLVLLKLVEYLGHPNALLNGLAYDEVRFSTNSEI